MLANLNWVAILAAAVVSFIVCMILFSPSVFGKKWASLTGTKLDDCKDKSCMVKGFILKLVEVTGFAYIFSWLGIDTQDEALRFALASGILIALPPMLGCVIWQKKPIGIFYINAVSTLIKYVVISLILVSMAGSASMPMSEAPVAVEAPAVE